MPTAHSMQRKRHPSLEARRGARIGTSSLALLLFGCSVSSSVSYFSVSFSLSFSVFSVHSSSNMGKGTPEFWIEVVESWTVYILVNGGLMFLVLQNVPPFFR